MIVWYSVYPYSINLYFDADSVSPKRYLCSIHIPIILFI